jgi:hypothetical protein
MMRNKVIEGIYERSKREEKGSYQSGKTQFHHPVLFYTRGPHLKTAQRSSLLKISEVLRGKQFYLVVFAQSFNFARQSRASLLWTLSVCIKCRCLSTMSIACAKVSH